MNGPQSVLSRIQRLWSRVWMLGAGHGRLGRLAMRFAAWGAPPYRARNVLARLSPVGFIAPSAVVHHARVKFGRHVFIGDRVVLYQPGEDGAIELGDRVHLYSDACLETSRGALLTIGAETTIHMRCQLMAHQGSIRVGRGVAMAAGCALYSYDHGFAPGTPIRRQPIQSKGDIVVGDDVWLGTGVIVLSGVTIGEGAVIGAGSVVTRDVPPDAVAVGNPARVVRLRGASADRPRLAAVRSGRSSDL